MSLRSFLLKRFLYTLVLILFVIVLNWLIFEAMPGLQGQLYTVLANPRRINDQQYENLIHQYGLDKPAWEQFLLYLKSTLTFQFGYSYTSGQSISTEVITSGRLFNTLLLLGSSTILAIIIGILLGIVAAHKRGSAFDTFWVTGSLTSFSLPTFFMGILLIILFSVTFRLFPPGGTVPLAWSVPPIPPFIYQIPTRLWYLFLPSLTLTLFSYGGFLLLTRATMLEVLSEDYITTARAKGLPERTVLLRHAFKNASLPVITSGALAFGGVLSGAIITETVFNWQGLGLWLFNSVIQKDFPVLQAMFYIIALCVIIANFVSDLIYGIVDPRIRYD